MERQKGLVCSICLVLILLAGGIGYTIGRGPFIMARQVESTLKNEALTPPDNTTMDRAACRALAQAVEDEYTQWLSPEQMRALVADLSGETRVGIGAEMVITERGWRVAAVSENGPAAKAGLAKGDLVTKINGNPVFGANWQPEEGGTALFCVEREGLEREIVVIPQETEPLPPVVAKTLPGAYGYIRIRSFVQENVEQAFADAMAQVATDNGVVIDVRHNPGGRMEAVLAMLDEFLPEKTEILRLYEAKGKQTHYKTEKGQRYTMPVVVLTDGQSASAAEIFAGVLQKHNRAMIVGETTYGKGVVQKMKSLGDGSGLKYTMAEYRLADDTAIHGKGVVPDLTVVSGALPGWAETETEDDALQAALLWLSREKTQ